MPFNYYKSFSDQLERITKLYELCYNPNPTLGEELEKQSARWREMMCNVICCDDMPPKARRDLLALVQNLGYVAYETAQLYKAEDITSPAVRELLLPLERSITAIREETLLLDDGDCCAERIRRQAVSLISKWQELFHGGLSPAVSEGIEAVTECVLRYADVLEIAAAMR